MSMSSHRTAVQPSTDRGRESDSDVAVVPVQPDGTVRPKEIGGRDGPDPTRYGDWEKAGRCIDF
jgi:hypothetical protein